MSVGKDTGVGNGCVEAALVLFKAKAVCGTWSAAPVHPYRSPSCSQSPGMARQSSIGAEPSLG